MITIEQIQELDQKVQAAVQRISTLKGENTSLQSKLGEYEKRIAELEILIDRFKQDQSEIENGIIRALEQLDHLEDSIDDSPTADSDDPVTDAPSEEVAEADTPGTDESVDEKPPADESPDASMTDGAAEQDENQLDIF